MDGEYRKARMMDERLRLIMILNFVYSISIQLHSTLIRNMLAYACE